MKINHFAVILSAVAYWLLGGLWYSKFLFADKFVQYMRWSPEQLAEVEKASHAKELTIVFVGALIAAYVLAYFLRTSASALDGVKTAFLIWLGFLVTTHYDTVLFEGRPLGLFLINTGFHLVGLLIMGTIVAAWKPRAA